MAILLVITWHYFNNQVVRGQTTFIDFGFRITSNTWSGVDLFFILSGYLIGTILMNVKHSPNYFSTFYRRRFFRIFPIYYLLLIIYVILIHSVTDLDKVIPSLFGNYLPEYPYFFLFQNYMMIIKNSLGASWLSATWSLAIEEQFYLLLPLLIFFLNKRALTIIAAVLIISAALFRFYSGNWFNSYLAFQCRMDTLFSGVLIAVMFENQQIVNFLKSKKYIVYSLFLTGAFWFIFISLYTRSSFYFLTYSGLIIFYSSFLMIALLYKESYISKILRTNFLRKIGTISYGIYLFHLIVINFIYWLLEKWKVDIYNNTNIVIVGIIAFLITYSISFISYRYFESRLIIFSHKYKY